MLFEYIYVVNENIRKDKFIEEVLKNLIEKESKYKIDIDKFVIFYNQKNSETREIEKVILFSFRVEKFFHSDTRRKEVFFILEVDFYDNYSSEEDINELFNDLGESIQKVRECLRKQKGEYLNKVLIIKDLFAQRELIKSYPEILYLENKMRELISKIMLFKAKKNWFKNEIPENIKNIIQNRKEKRKYDDIFALDFSHLKDILFKRNENSLSEVLFSMIENIEDCNEVNLDKLKNKVPKSNWEKYFKDLEFNSLDNIKNLYKGNHKLKTDEDYIKELLKDLQEDRNNIAHNNLCIENNFLENFKIKSNYLFQWITNAIYELEKEFKLISKRRIYENLSDKNKILINRINKLLEQLIKKEPNVLNLVKKEENRNKNICKKLNNLLKLKEQIENELYGVRDLDLEQSEIILKEIEDNFEKECMEVFQIQIDENTIIQEEQ